MIVIVVIVGVLYTCMFLYLSKHQGLKSQQIDVNLAGVNNFSLIIPATDEDDNLPYLIESLVQQNYDTNLFEIIVVLDNPTKNLKDTCAKLANDNVAVTENIFGTGKKKALLTGIELAKNNFIIQLDADCSVQLGFLLAYDQFIRTKSVDLIIGIVLPAVHNSDSILSKMFALEHISLLSTQFNLALISKPSLASGANMLYRKDKFLTIKDEWLAIPTDSGDDVFMVQLFKKQNYKILINDCDEAIVKTGLPENLSEFINQRVRWGAKTKYYKDSFLKFLALIVVFQNLIIVSLFALILFGKCSPADFAMVFFFKVLIDYFYLRPYLFRFDKKFLANNFLLASAAYPFYLIFTSTKANFGNTNWKN